MNSNRQSAAEKVNPPPGVFVIGDDSGSDSQEEEYDDENENKA